MFEESNETDMSELESEESAAKRNIASRAKLRRQILNTIKEKKRTTMNCLVITLTIQAQAICSAN